MIGEALDTAAPRAPALSDLMRAGLRLDAAASTLNGYAERGDSDALEHAIHNYQLEKDEFRLKLETATEVNPDLIARWLAL